jgi:hypothetical protein
MAGNEDATSRLNRGRAEMIFGSFGSGERLPHHEESRSYFPDASITKCCAGDSDGTE